MKRWILGAVLAAPLLAAAAEPVPMTGSETRVWLALQRSGNAALAAPRPTPGEVADKIYQRYLNSFATPIPASFTREQFVSGGSSGSNR
jgi:hypothetical protein